MSTPRDNLNSNWAAGRLTRLACLVLAVAMTASCMMNNSFRRRSINRSRAFHSPLQPTDSRDLGLEQIRSRLEARRSSVKTIKATLDLVGGSDDTPGQQVIQTQVFTRPPNLLRIRGSQVAGTMFDVLLDRDDLQMVVYPEQKYYTGSVQDLRSNPRILGGFNPEELPWMFLIETQLLDRLRDPTMIRLSSDKKHYIVDVTFPNGLVERYWLRDSDLLVDCYERFYGRSTVIAIYYWGYEYTGTNHLLPTHFTADFPAAGGQFTVRVNSFEVNGPPPPEIGRVRVPEGFERLSLAR